jgi:beta-glucosidase-like glycosyl hydrolase
MGNAMNETLYHLVGRADGREARAINNLRNHKTQNVYGDGIDYWSPTINLQRDPRWGRNQEVPGEDPLLTSKYAMNFVHGLQSGDEDKKHIQIIATCKHFIANSLENWMGHTRHNFNAKIAAGDLADYYAVPFKACLTPGQGGALGVMVSELPVV